jgi:hypothetical protein
VRLNRLLPIALVPLVLAGCGDPEHNSDEAKIGDVTRHFFTALRDEDWDIACRDLSYAAQGKLVAWGAQQKIGEDCGAALEAGLGSLGDLSQVDIDKIHIDDVDVDGDRATAKVSPNRSDERVPYVREGGEWLIASNAFIAEEGKSAPTATTPASERRLKGRAGFGSLPDGRTSWGVELRNTQNADALDVRVRVTFAGDGSTDERTIASIPVGQTAWIGGEADTSKPVRDISLSAHVGTWGDPGRTRMPAPAAGRLSRTADGVTVEADLDNDLEVPLKPDTPVYAVLMDRYGEIVGGISGRLRQPIAPRSSATVTLQSSAPNPDALHAEVSADAPVTP